MKKLLFNIVWVLQLVILVGCNKPYYYDYQELKAKIASVEIIDVKAMDGGKVVEEQSLYVLAENEIDVFLKEFCRIECLDNTPPGVRLGYCVKLIYTDYSYHVIGRISGAYYSKEGERLGFVWGVNDIESFEMLLSQYIEIE